MRKAYVGCQLSPSNLTSDWLRKEDASKIWDAALADISQLTRSSESSLISGQLPDLGVAKAVQVTPHNDFSPGAAALDVGSTVVPDLPHDIGCGYGCLHY